MILRGFINLKRLLSLPERMENSLLASTAAVSVRTRAEMEFLPLKNLAATLETFPGISFFAPRWAGARSVGNATRFLRAAAKQSICWF